MRVNVDSQALRDPRFRRAAKRLNVSHHEVLARCLSVWMVCYERREPVITREDVDIAAELDGFTDAMVFAELAEMHGDSDTEVYVRGVSERIGFLERQSDRGKRSGHARREMSAATRKRTSVQQTLELPLNERSISRSTVDRTNSPDLAPDQDLLEHEPPGRSPPSSQSVSRSGGDHTPTPASKPPHAASGEVSEPARELQQDPPEHATTLAVLLLDHIVANNQGSRIANQAARKRSATITRWAWTIEKLHRLDGQSWGTIHGMIDWCAKSEFWAKVILGADALRENWDKMNAQRSRSVTKGRGVSTGHEPRRGPSQAALDEVAALEAAEAEDSPREPEPVIDKRTA